MNSKVIITTDNEKRTEEFNLLLQSLKLNINHPDVLILAKGQKIGIEETKKLRGFITIKPQASLFKVVIIEDAKDLTIDGQNSLLKTLEELPEQVFFLIGADSADTLLPTVISRCELIYIKSLPLEEGDLTAISELLEMDLDKRFEYIEKVEDKSKLLKNITHYFQKRLTSKKDLENMKKILNAEKWQKQNVSIRPILEYLMLEL